MWKQISQLVRRRWRRTLVTLIPLVFALLHLSGVLHLQMLERLDNIIYDTRLRATMPRTLDERIVIIDIDEKSLERIGHWPWGRDKMATLATELFERQQVAVVGFDVLFAEADGSSGLDNLQRLAQGALSDQPEFKKQLAKLAPSLDYDSLFAKSLEGRPAVLGYYLTNDKDGRTKGVLPPPALPHDRLRGLPLKAYSWAGYGSNIEVLATAVPVAGFFNSVTDEDGVVRALPLLAEYQGRYYESLALAMFRVALGLPEVYPGFANNAPDGYADTLQSIGLRQDGRTLALPVDDRIATLIPFRGPGDVAGGSFQYLSASDVLEGTLPPGQLKDRMILVGSTAPGLLDLRVTPVGRAYPGVETHANVLSALLEGKNIVRPDYVVGFDAVQLVCAGLLLALALPAMSAAWAVILSLALTAGLTGLNVWFYISHGRALPLASALVMVLSAFTLNMVYGYFVESRSKRELAHLFGTYVPPELVDEMVKQPENYSMQADMRELTVMFCDIRGFTTLSERMEPVPLQALLNTLFSRLTLAIRKQRGTIDKYMGDCVMAFWGAPIAAPDHARLAIQASLAMGQAIRLVNAEHEAQGLPAIGVGIGINTGPMCVGDMGSDVRRSYTVIGDAVNLGSRLEGLCKVYGVEIVASESTRDQTPDIVWLELDRVRVKGKEQPIAIFHPLGNKEEASGDLLKTVERWHDWLMAFRTQNWLLCDSIWPKVKATLGRDQLLAFYAQRLQEQRVLPFNPDWNGTTHFDTK